MATALRVAAPAADILPDGADKTLLRFITCGSVDDGKSTLIGRLLYDSKLLLDDQLASLERDSARPGAAGAELDFASLVDGLAAEREQGITIDVAYRFFATDTRKFIVADTPGHEQYTRNMATGASTADLAIILIDARKGVLPQTRRHSRIAHLLGIRHLVLAVNKMDLVDYDEAAFDAIVADYRDFASAAGIGDFTAIPLSGLAGDNVIRSSMNMPWYAGPPLLRHLERVELDAGSGEAAGFHFPVQWVNRPNQDFRGYAGTVAEGAVRAGDPVRILPSGRRTRVARIVTFGGERAEARAGQAVTLVLADEVDCSRGDMIVGDGAEVETVDRIAATLIWMAGEPLVPGRSYWLKIGPLTVAASVARIVETVEIEGAARGDGRGLSLNEIARCELLLDRPVPALPYARSRRLGGFILIDRATHATLAAGMIDALDAGAMEESHQGSGRIIRLTGANAAERDEFARKARRRLLARGRPSFVLDRAALADLSEEPLREDDAAFARRAAESARLLSRAGVTVLLSLDLPAESAPGPEINLSDPGADWDWII